MAMYLNTVITATGSCIPEIKIPNSHFLNHKFYTPEGKPEINSTEVIVRKFLERTGIKSRRYARTDQVASDLGSIAVMNSGIDIYSLDMLIGASNYGDMEVGKVGYPVSVFVPCLAALVAGKAGYVEERGYFKTYDLINGCPGFLEALIDADLRIRSERLPEVNMVGAVAMETLSRVVDKSNKDGMLFGDGAGFAVLKGSRNNRQEGILSYVTKTIRYFETKKGMDPRKVNVTDCAKYITTEDPNNPELVDGHRVLKMVGPNVSSLAMAHVPEVALEALERAKVNIEDIKLLLLHQANGYLIRDMALACGIREEEIDARVPITLDWLANTSLASIPTMLDLIRRRKLISPNGHLHVINPGDKILMAAVGADMDVNAIVYEESIAA